MIDKKLILSMKTKVYIFYITYLFIAFIYEKRIDNVENFDLNTHCLIDGFSLQIDSVVIHVTIHN